MNKFASYVFSNGWWFQILGTRNDEHINFVPGNFAAHVLQIPAC